MSGFWSKHIDCICYWCHREYEIHYQTRFEKLFVTAHFCPFCGHRGEISAEDLANQGYELR